MKLSGPVLAAALAAIVFFVVDQLGIVGGLPRIVLKGSAVAILAASAAANARSRDGWLLAGVMAAGALGDMFIELSIMLGAAAFAVGHAIAIWLYLANRRPAPMPMSQKAAAAALLLTAPLLWLLAGKAGDAGVALYVALLTLMAATAWTSRFSRYRTGVGALMFLVSDALILADLGGKVDPGLAALAIWPLYAAGQILIFVGVRTRLAVAPR